MNLNLLLRTILTISSTILPVKNTNRRIFSTTQVFCQTVRRNKNNKFNEI